VANQNIGRSVLVQSLLLRLRQTMRRWITPPPELPLPGASNAITVVSGYLAQDAVISSIKSAALEPQPWVMMILSVPAAPLKAVEGSGRYV
jgi:hypothetical protein